MIPFPAFFLFTLVVAYILYEWLKWRRYASLPPGPAAVPVLGNMHSVIGQKRPNYEIVTEFSKTYGDIMTFWIFNKPVVFLSSMRAIKEAFGDNKEISDRPAINAELTGLFGLEDYSDKTQVIRNAFVQSIRSFWNSPLAEEQFVRVVDDVTEAMISVEHETNKPIFMNEYITKMLFNAAMLLLFGKRFAWDDPLFLLLISEGELANHDLLNVNDLCNVKLFLWKLLRLHHLSARFKRTNEYHVVNVNKILKILYDDVNTRVRDKDDGIESVAHTLIERFKHTKKGVGGDVPSIYRGIQIGGQDIMNTLCVMIFGATSTTIVSLNWLVLEMVLHPEIQEKCYQQLMEVTNGRPVTQSDRSRLPYIEACIMESIRRHPPTTFNSPHVSQSDITIRNYKIPAGVLVVKNSWGTRSDENTVKDAHHFNPDNFLDDEGQFFRNQNLFPFGVGRRMCPGEVQAKLSLFFAFATMLRRVRFERVEKSEYDTVPDPSKLPVLVPKKYYVIIKERKPRTGIA